jgi:hypothetical protein
MHGRYQACIQDPNSHYREAYEDKAPELVDVYFSSGAKFDRKKAELKIADGYFDPPRIVLPHCSRHSPLVP